MPPTSGAGTPPPRRNPPESDEVQDRRRIDVLVTVPRGEVNQAQAQECEERAECRHHQRRESRWGCGRQIGDDGQQFAERQPRERTGNAMRRETRLQKECAAPRPTCFGIPDNGPPRAPWGGAFWAAYAATVLIDVEAPAQGLLRGSMRLTHFPAVPACSIQDAN